MLIQVNVNKVLKGLSWYCDVKTGEWGEIHFPCWKYRKCYQHWVSGVRFDVSVALLLLINTKGPMLLFYLTIRESCKQIQLDQNRLWAHVESVDLPIKSLFFQNRIHEVLEQSKDELEQTKQQRVVSSSFLLSKYRQKEEEEEEHITLK